MKVYFVRHAESTFNRSGIHQPMEAPLSVCGRQQANSVGNKFLALPVDIILTSSQDRAKETARIISQKVNKKVVSIYLLGENRKPSQLIGKRKKSKETKKATALFLRHSQDPRWYLSDEENFQDLLSRAKRALKYISLRKEKNVLVITHSTFMKVVILTMMFGDSLNSDMYYKFVKFFSTKNTGITLCERKKRGKWRLHTWNDYTHLRKAEPCNAE